MDAQGRFRIEGLVPGVKYDASGSSPNRADGTVFKRRAGRAGRGEGPGRHQAAALEEGRELTRCAGGPVIPMHPDRGSFLRRRIPPSSRS